MEQLDFNFNDGGRSLYFRADKVGDCVVRAAAIASGRDYKQVYDLAKQINRGTPRNGLSKKSVRTLMSALGGVWHSTMSIGSGCTNHLRRGEIPMSGRIVVSLSGHCCAVVDGVINDTYNCSRGGSRCVYGFWVFSR